jgi:Uma2 family endonuclease
MTTRTRMTSAEFLALPETMQRMELIDGEIIVAPAPELFHQDVAFLAAVLVRNVGSSGRMYISPVDVHFADGEITQPDVLWLAPDSVCQSVDGKFL